ncbi:MAG: dihydroorotase [Pirellulaceae bacterium]|nr:dihydroorotase [Pirellulaceae bacterium]
MPSLLIRHATVILPSGRAKTNILVKEGKITAIDASDQTEADEILDCPGQIVLPGLVDDQVHFREPGLTHKEDLATASSACAAGGVTSFLEMPNTKPSATTRSLVEAKYEIAQSKSIVNYGFYIGASSTNVDELRQAENIPGIKIFIGSSTGDLLVDDQQALERIFAETTLPICAHCEDETTVKNNLVRLGGQLTVSDHSRIRDVQAAVVATRRALDLASRHQHRFHVLHVSTADELPLIAAAKPYITAEICPHHLFFNVDDYEQLGSLIQMNPSIKSKRDNVALWNALLDGTVQVIATDHSPHTLAEKKEPYPRSPSGLPSVENSLALLMNQAHQGKCTWEQIANWMSDAPARVWGLVGKGRIEIGYDADLVIVDPNRSRTIRNELQFSKSGWSPWNGVTLTGWATRTIVNGVGVFIDDGKQPRGTILSRSSASRLRCDHQRGGYWSTLDGIGV